MRTTTVQGESGSVYTITFGDDILFTKDNNTLKVERSDEGGLAVKVTVLQEQLQETRILEYSSEKNYIIFDLSDVLYAMFTEYMCDFTIQVDILTNSILTNLDATYTYSTELLDGKSFPNRKHGESKHLYIYSDTAEFTQMYFPESGSITVGSSTVPVLKGFNSVDLSNLSGNSIHFGNDEIPTATIDSYTVHTWDYTFMATFTDDNDEYNYDIETEHADDCYSETENNDYVRIKYRDTDGCIRYVSGKIISNKHSATFGSYSSAESIFSNTPYNIRTKESQNVTVGFSEIPHSIFFSDILYSDLMAIEYHGEWIPCTLETKDLTIDIKNDSQDYELDFCINRK